MATFADLSEHMGTVISILGIMFFLLIALLTAFYKLAMKFAMEFKGDILQLIGSVDVKINEIYLELNSIREKQASLREKLPIEYLRLEGPGYKALTTALREIKDALIHFRENVFKGDQ